jgi:hypothetical protein
LLDHVEPALVGEMPEQAGAAPTRNATSMPCSRPRGPCSTPPVWTRPTLSALLDAAAAEGAIRGDIGAEDLLYAIAQLCRPVPGGVRSTVDGSSASWSTVCAAKVVKCGRSSPRPEAAFRSSCP